METSDLQSIQKSIEQSAPEKRAKLLRFVAAVFNKENTNLPNQQLTILTSLAEFLFDQVDQQALCDAAEIFSTLDTAPHDLIVRFANETIDVAAPILQNSTVLDDNDLVDIIENHGNSHMQAIASRGSLTSFVTDCLISKAEAVTLTTIIRNRGACISDEGFRELAAIGTTDTTVGEALSVRPDMPEEIAAPLMESLGVDDIAKASGDVRQLGIKYDAQTHKAGAMRRERALFLPRAKTSMDLIGKGELTINECVLQLCKEEAVQTLCQVIAARAQVSETTVSSAFTKVGGTKFLQLCKKVDLSIEAFEAAVILRTQLCNLPNSQIFYLLRQYESISLSKSDSSAIAV